MVSLYLLPIFTLTDYVSDSDPKIKSGYIILGILALISLVNIASIVISLANSVYSTCPWKKCQFE